MAKLNFSFFGEVPRPLTPLTPTCEHFFIQYSIPGGVLGISSDRDDQMEAKVKTQKNPEGFQQNPKKTLDQKLTPKKSHADYCGNSSDGKAN